MKLRTILLVLSLLAFLSATIGGYLYYSSLKEAALKEADRQAYSHAETIKNHLASFLSENQKSVRALSGLKELRQALLMPGRIALGKANTILDHFRDALNASVCYMMDRDGYCVASSNREETDSFVGKNYAFRPYYKQAMRGESAIYMALGITSLKRGVYYSHPIYDETKATPLGVAVIKASIDPIERQFSQSYEGTVLLTDPNGIVFISNRKSWLYKSLKKHSPEKIIQIADSRQFGRGPWNWIGLETKNGKYALNDSGNEYLMNILEIDNYPGWSLIYLSNTRDVFKRVSSPLMKISGYIILTLCVLIGLSVLLLYRKARSEILRREMAEDALRASQETERALLNAPTESALLLDTAGTILALNQPAAKLLGKDRDKLVGLDAFHLFSPDIASLRKTYHNEVINHGRPVRYEDEREGRYYDTNVYPVFDSQGKVVRVAIFSHDITEQKRAEKELKHAKEELSRHSRNLEAQVKERTKEISSILENTPAVVFIKDKNFKYIMVNSRYEELFGIKNEDVRGRSDFDIFPKETAAQFRENDLYVLENGIPFQVEETVHQEDGIHTYLSVKFPLFNEKGDIRSLCGIATDITGQKEAQDQLRRLSASIMDSQEKERTLVARELHDELGQMLTALRMDSVWVRDHLQDNNPKASERARNMCELIDKTIDDVRGMSLRLRPGVLDDLGLIDALEWFTSEFEKRSGIACIFSHANVPTVKNTLATSAYRIAQEALTNVARHSSATHVEVVLRSKDNILILSVVDNGCGFSTQKLSDTDCLGIVGMRERASLAGGNLEIESKPEKGTKVCFRLSLHA